MWINKNKKNTSFLKNKNKYVLISTLIISLYIIFTYNYENFCTSCINNNLTNRCLNCTNNAIFGKIKIHDEDETLNEIITKNKSISRFGDGELILILGEDIGFQRYDQNLSAKLFKILNIKEKNLLIGINLPYKLRNLNRLNLFAKNYYKFFLRLRRFKFAKLFLNREYYSSMITRFYMDLKSKRKVPKYIKKLKKIWDKRDVVIIEGDKSRLGVGNDLFNNMKSIQRIICPALNAFKYYENIINAVKTKVSKDKLILIALGPTATALAYDLYKLGYQAIDVGHIDIEYEWYLRKAGEKINIKNKYVNEAGGYQEDSSAEKDKNYYQQVLLNISNLSALKK